MKTLPEIAYSTLLVNPCQVIAIRRGESGYYPLIEHPSEDSAKLQAERMNTLRGVTRPQLQAMRAGSVFGWSCPAADPDSYEADGSMKP